MKMSNVMAVLAEYSSIGIGVITILCIAIYLTISIKIVKFCRKEQVNVAVMGMLPVIQLICWVRGVSAKVKRVKLSQIQKEQSPEEEEIDLGL